MPFLSDAELEGDNFVRIQSDIFDDYNEPRQVSLDIAPPVPAGVTVVSMDDKLEMNTPVADMEGEMSNNHGRSSRSLSATPVQSTSKTPKSAKSTGSPTPKSAEKSSGRKRKAVDIEEPGFENANEDVEHVAPAKRGRKPAAAPSARLATKAAKKKGPGRPAAANGTTSKAKPKSKVGRPKKDAGSDVVPKGEYEVEAIVDSMIDADTMEHMYYVKWKGYPSSDNTWEPKQNLQGANELLRKFNADKKAKKSEYASEKKAKKAKTSHKAEKAEKKMEKAPKAPKAAGKKVKPKGRPGRPPKAGKEAKPAKETKAPAKAPKKTKEVKVPKAGTRVSSRTKSA